MNDEYTVEEKDKKFKERSVKLNDQDPMKELISLLAMSFLDYSGYTLVLANKKG